MERSETIDALAKALVRVQGNMQNAVKGADNPFFKSTYATLADIWEVARKPLTNSGLSVTQLCESAEGQAVVIETVLLHESGQWISGKLSMPYTKNDPQAVGSAISYGRRYALQSILGIVAEEDDDGNGAAGKGTFQKAEPPAPQTPPPARTPEPPANAPSLIEGMDCKQAQVKINSMILDMHQGHTEDAADYLARLTAWTNKEGKAIPGKKTAFELGVKANAKGGTQTSIVYHQVKEAYEKWGQEEGGMM